MVAAVVGIMYLPPAEKAEMAEMAGHTEEAEEAEAAPVAEMAGILLHIPDLPAPAKTVVVVVGTLRMHPVKQEGSGRTPLEWIWNIQAPVQPVQPMETQPEAEVAVVMEETAAPAPTTKAAEEAAVGMVPKVEMLL